MDEATSTEETTSISVFVLKQADGGRWEEVGPRRGPHARAVAREVGEEHGPGTYWLIPPSARKVPVEAEVGRTRIRVGDPVAT